MEITFLPPGPLPVTVTAKSRTINLEEHLTSFLYNNNLHGFKIEEHFEIKNEFLEILNYSFQFQNVKVDQLRKDGFKIKKMAGSFKLNHVYLILAQLLGYKDWSVLIANEVNGMVSNLNHGKLNINTSLHDPINLSSIRPYQPHDPVVRRHIKESNKNKGRVILKLKSRASC